MKEGSTKVVVAALAGNSLIAIIKLAVALVTGSAALLAEGVHSVADTG
ncbi:MAG TPA: cation transporter, partial [Myxococcota bacterium]|nr:cation transporter [Myxococcota bacterium]